MEKPTFHFVVAHPRLRCGCDACNYGVMPNGDFCLCEAGQARYRLYQKQFTAMVTAPDVDLSWMPSAFRGQTWAGYRDRAIDKGVALVFCIEYAKTGQLAGKESLLLFGPPGTGKTSLACLIGQKRAEAGAKIRFIEFYSFFGSLGAMDYQQAEATILRMESAPFLILDDLGSMERTGAETARRIEIVGRIINSRMAHRRPFIATTNLSIEHIEAQFGQRIASRLMGVCTFVQVDGKDLRR